MTFMGGSAKMTQNELEALTRAAQQGQLAPNAMNQSTGVFTQAGIAHQQLAQQSHINIYGQNLSAQWGNSTATARSVLEDHEKREIRMQEREACFQLVMDMAEELNCPNLLHGVALAIKARGPK